MCLSSCFLPFAIVWSFAFGLFFPPVLYGLYLVVFVRCFLHCISWICFNSWLFLCLRSYHLLFISCLLFHVSLLLVFILLISSSALGFCLIKLSMTFCRLCPFLSFLPVMSVFFSFIPCASLLSFGVCFSCFFFLCVSSVLPPFHCISLWWVHDEVLFLGLWWGYFSCFVVGCRCFILTIILSVRRFFCFAFFLMRWLFVLSPLLPPLPSFFPCFLFLYTVLLLPWFLSLYCFISCCFLLQSLLKSGNPKTNNTRPQHSSSFSSSNFFSSLLFSSSLLLSPVFCSSLYSSIFFAYIFLLYILYLYVSSIWCSYFLILFLLSWNISSIFFLSNLFSFSISPISCDPRLRSLKRQVVRRSQLS